MFRREVLLAANWQFTRIVRTPHSERYLIVDAGGGECAALELHYVPDGTVAGTLILFAEAKIAESTVPELLRQIDDRLLPEVSIAAHNLSFTVVEGRVLGNFVPDHEAPA